MPQGYPQGCPQGCPRGAPGGALAARPEGRVQAFAHMPAHVATEVFAAPVGGVKLETIHTCQPAQGAGRLDWPEWQEQDV